MADELAVFPAKTSRAPWFVSLFLSFSLSFSFSLPFALSSPSLSISLRFCSFLLFCIWCLHLVGYLARIHISFLLSFCFSQAVVHDHGRRGSSGFPVKTSRAPWFVSVSLCLALFLPRSFLPCSFLLRSFLPCSLLPRSLLLSFWIMLISCFSAAFWTAFVIGGSFCHPGG